MLEPRSESRVRGQAGQELGLLQGRQLGGYGPKLPLPPSFLPCSLPRVSCSCSLWAKRRRKPKGQGGHRDYLHRPAAGTGRAGEQVWRDQ